jgi:hypothetical protein
MAGQTGASEACFEAIYVKVLAGESEFLRPSAAGMTPVTNALFNFLYPHASTEAQPPVPADRLRRATEHCAPS